MDGIIKNISTLTSIPVSALDRLVDISNHCISNSFYHSLISDSDITEIDLGIGVLMIKKDNDALKFKFVPSAKLREELTEVLKTKKSTLTKVLEDSLKEAVTNTYKDLF